MRLKFDEFEPEQPNRNSVIEKLILFSISEDDKAVLLYLAKKLSLVGYTDSLFHFLRQLTVAIFIYNDYIDAITST